MAISDSGFVICLEDKDATLCHSFSLIPSGPISVFPPNTAGLILRMDSNSYCCKAMIAILGSTSGLSKLEDKKVTFSSITNVGFIDP